MGIINWFKKRMSYIALATAKVEESTLTQRGTSFDGGISHVQDVNQGRLSDSLQKGEITQEVKELRWRMYKVLKATDGVSAKISGYDDDGMPIVTITESKVTPLKNVKVDNADEYDVLMIVNNSEIMVGTSDGVNIEAIEEREGEENEDKDGDKTKTIAEVSFDELLSNGKTERPISITREFKPKFEIEKYTKKLIVRDMGEDQRLLEFYVSMYPDEYDRKTRLLISEIKKAIKNPRMSDMLDIKGVNFITDKTMGAKDFRLYEFTIDKFDKIIEYDGHYVIKFKSTITTNGLDIVDKFKELDLDGRYDRKEAK
jgi:hypothetical protein